MGWIYNNKEWLFGGAGLGLLAWIIPKTYKYLSELIRNKEYRKLILNEDKKSADEKILKQLSKVFTGNIMFNFFELLETNRCIHIDQMEIFEHNINRFLAPDRVFRKENLEMKKREFLLSFKEFLEFSSYTFNTVTNKNNIARFHFGVNESDIYKENEKCYLRLLKRLYQKWSLLQEEIRRDFPEFEW